MDKEYKYICEKCNFKCTYQSVWNNHIKSEIHKTGKRKKRIDCKEPKKCEKCEYETKFNMSMKLHILSDHADLETRKKEYKYYCEICDFGTFVEKDIEKHNNTKKHNKKKMR